MDAQGKILAQLAAVQNAANAVKDRDPPDMDTFWQLESTIDDLNVKLAALENSPNIPPPTDTEVQGLTIAINTLDGAVRASAAATQILAAVTAVVSA